MYELKAVDKTFPGVHALKAVDFKIGRGEIVGLVGENGAGKSTLMKVIYGAYQPDGGTITIDGTTVRFQNPRQAMEHGIGMVFQEQSLITNLAVMENIFLGFEQQFVSIRHHRLEGDGRSSQARNWPRSSSISIRAW